MKKAYFDPRGCDFWKDEQYISDVGNFRLVACVTAKNGEPLIIEFGGWDRQETYKTPRGATKTRIADRNVLHVDAQHTVYNERPGNKFGPDVGEYDFNFERIGINTNDYHYTRADLLRFLSDVTGDRYTKMVFDGAKVDRQIEEIYMPVERAYNSKARAERERIEAERNAEREAFFAKWRASREAMNEGSAKQ